MINIDNKIKITTQRKNLSGELETETMLLDYPEEREFQSPLSVESYLNHLASKEIHSYDSISVKYKNYKISIKKERKLKNG